MENDKDKINVEKRVKSVSLVKVAPKAPDNYVMQKAVILGIAVVLAVAVYAGVEVFGKGRLAN